MSSDKQDIVQELVQQVPNLSKSDLENMPLGDIHGRVESMPDENKALKDAARATFLKYQAMRKEEESRAQAAASSLPQEQQSQDGATGGDSEEDEEDQQELERKKDNADETKSMFNQDGTRVNYLQGLYALLLLLCRSKSIYPHHKAVIGAVKEKAMEFCDKIHELCTGKELTPEEKVGIDEAGEQLILESKPDDVGSRLVLEEENPISQTSQQEAVDAIELALDNATDSMTDDPNSFNVQDAAQSVYNETLSQLSLSQQQETLAAVGSSRVAELGSQFSSQVTPVARAPTPQLTDDTLTAAASASGKRNFDVPSSGEEVSTTPIDSPGRR